MASENYLLFFVYLLFTLCEISQEAAVTHISKFSLDETPYGGYSQDMENVNIGIDSQILSFNVISDQLSYPTTPPSAISVTHSHGSGSISRIIPDSTQPSLFSDRFDSTTEPLTGGLFQEIDIMFHSPVLSEVPMDVWLNLTYIKTPMEFLQMIIPDLHNSSDPEINKLLQNKSLDKYNHGVIPRPNSADVTSGGMAAPANCEPRDAVIEVPVHKDPSIFNWPSCTIIKKCGGCCYHALLECIPKVSSKITRKVIQVRYPHIGAKNFEYRGVGDIELEQDEECTCTCRIKPEHCTDKQEHKDCQCICKNKDDTAKCKGENVIWNNKDCKCECKDILECPNAQVFNNKTCKCQVKAAGRIIDFDAYLISRLTSEKLPAHSSNS